VYVTDSKAAGSSVSVIALPAEAQAVASYPIAVVRASAHGSAAAAFASFVLSPPAQAVLQEAGFGPPPLP
jgi:molybdate transport system substrate-binding protein